MKDIEKDKLIELINVKTTKRASPRTSCHYSVRYPHKQEDESSTTLYFNGKHNKKFIHFFQVLLHEFLSSTFHKLPSYSLMKLNQKLC